MSGKVFFTLRCLRSLAALILLTFLAMGLCAEETENDDFIPLEEDADELVVTGTVETNQQIRRIDKETIDRIHAPDLAALLEAALGLGTTRYGPYGSQGDVNIRGFDSERIAILIDGIPVNDPESGDFDFSRIDPESIEAIEVIYGGSDTKYNVSGALGGVINIITIKKHREGIRFGGSFSNVSSIPGAYFDWKNQSAEPHWEDLADTQKISFFINQGFEKFSWSFSIFGSRAENHFLYKDDYDTMRRKEGNEVYDAGARTSLLWTLPDYSKLILSGDLYYADKNIPLGPNTNVEVNQTVFSSGQNILFEMPRAFHDDLAMEASLSANEQSREYTGATGGRQSLQVINRWSWYPLPALTFRSGADYRFIAIDSLTMGNKIGNNGGLYITAEYKPQPKLLLSPSVKFIAAARPETEAQFAFVPKLGILWKPLETLTVKNNYFRSFKLPDLEDLYWDEGQTEGLRYTGSPDLKNEDGWGADLGIQYRFPPWVELETAIFAQWTLDSIHWSGTGGVWRPQNIGEAVFFGSDSRLTGKFLFSKGPFTKFSASLTYQYLLSFILSYGYDFNSEKRIPYMPEHSLGITGEIFWKSGSFLVAGRYESLRYTDTANLSSLDSLFLVDVTVNQDIGKNYSLFAVVRNALNISYQSFKDYPMPGLSLTAGMRMAFEKKKEKGEKWDL
ncbi:hypothetical protein AGMMS49928_19200 [Spirochaetia bacterium]|nr:hypothetical protein AGMMS49928_19200 [Spirochaetia bacterium]